jgi:hypothetical protein
MKTLRIMAFVILALAVMAVVGCKEKGSTPDNVTTEIAGIDLSKPIAEVKAAAEKMDVAQLRTMAEKCIAAVKDKESAVSALVEKQKALPLDKIAADGQKIMDEVKEVQASITKLQEVFKVYYDALVTKGGDVSSLQMP